MSNLDRTNWPGVAFGLSLSAFVAFQHYKLPPVLPVMLDQYGYDRVLAGGLMSIYALAGLLLSMPAGRWLQRHGARSVVVALGVLFLVGNLLGLAAPEQGGVMLVSRGLEGIGYAIGAVAGPAIATAHTSARHRTLVIGMMAGWIPAGQLVASALTPFALELGGWQPIWILSLLVALGFMLWGRIGDRDAYLPGAAGAGGVYAVRFARGELIALWLGGALFMLWSGQYAAFMTWLPPFLVEVHGFAEVGAVLGYSLPVAVLLAFNVLTGLFLRWGAPLPWLISGAVIAQASFWWAAPYIGPGWDGFAMLVFYGIGAGITPTCLFALPTAIVGARRVAGAFGIIMTGRNLGVFLGPIAFAHALDALYGWNGAIRLIAISTAIAAAIAVLLAVKLRRFAPPDGLGRS
ncbi:MAG: MFS transporter [Rhodospirillaceae bacterium]|nr:MFS transporter [Rhodospirillaceae bacterium]